MKQSTVYWIIGGTIAAVAGFLIYKNRKLRKSLSDEALTKQEKDSAPSVVMQNDEFFVALGSKPSSDSSGIKEGSKGRWTGAMQLALLKITGKGKVDYTWKKSDTANFKTVYDTLGFKTPFDTAFMSSGNFYLSNKNYQIVGSRMFLKYPSKLSNLAQDPKFIEIVKTYGI